MNRIQWIRSLQEERRKDLCDYLFWDFVLSGRDVFLDSKVVEMLDQLEALYQNDDLLFDLYVLAFVYRHTSHFEEIVNGESYYPPLLPLPQKDSSGEGEGTSSENTTSKENELTESQQFTKRVFDYAEANKENDLKLKLSTIEKDAAGFKERMRTLFHKYSTSKGKMKPRKNEVIFRKIYEKEITLTTGKVSGLLEDEAKRKGMTYESLRRGYYRWKNETDHTPIDKRWPSDEFLMFCAFISVKYVPENSNRQNYILCEEPDIETRQIYNAMHETIKMESHDARLEREYQKALACQDKREMEAQLRKLAGKNYHPAIKEYLSSPWIADKDKRPYWIRAAILGDADAMKKLKWQAPGLFDHKLMVASQDRLKLADISDMVTGAPIKPGTILHSIKFQVDINTEVWQDLRPKLKKIKVSDQEYTEFRPNFTKDLCRKTVSMAATAKNFNLLMQHVDSLYITHVKIYFSSRHGRKQEKIEATIARPSYFWKWPWSSKEGELISPSVFARSPS